MIKSVTAKMSVQTRQSSVKKKTHSEAKIGIQRCDDDGGGGDEDD